MSTFYVPLEEATKAELIAAIRAGFFAKRDAEIIEDKIYELRGEAAHLRVKATLDACTACKTRTGMSFAEFAAHVARREQLEAEYDAANREWDKYMFDREKTPKKYQRTPTDS